MKEIVTFQAIQHVDPEGNEYWLARELYPVLEYSSWDKFGKVIGKAMKACEKSGQNADNHFSRTGKMAGLGSGASRTLVDWKLSRYACYLIVQNGDPSKNVIANGQTYFAVQARRQEVQDERRFAQLSEDERRLILRNELAEHNKALTAAAKEAGVETGLDYAIFQDHGYKGLYGGIGAKEIHERKHLEKSQKILDHMGSTELAANLFRATQTEDKLKRENISSKKDANAAHHEVGKKVRQTIADLGGTMPENLPTPKKSIRELERTEKGIE